MRHGILSKDTHQTVVRLAPPLVISAEQVRDALAAIGAAFSEIERVRHAPGVLGRPQTVAA
jgi:ornithine--oxo-acid transaminase